MAHFPLVIEHKKAFLEPGQLPCYILSKKGPETQTIAVGTRKPNHPVVADAPLCVGWFHNSKGHHRNPGRTIG
jgi:hypothetical protein